MLSILFTFPRLHFPVNYVQSVKEVHFSIVFESCSTKRVKIMIFFLFVILSQIICGFPSEILSRTISIVIEEACLKQTSTVDIRFLSNDTESDEILRRSEIPLRIESKLIFDDLKELKKCNVFVMKSLKDFEEFNKLLNPEIYDFRGIFLVIFINGNLSEIEKIFTTFWSHQIVNVNAIYLDPLNVTSIATFMPFQNHKCNDTTPQIINQFKDGKFTSNNFFIDKLENLQECPMRVIIATKSEPYIILNPGHKHGGRDIDLIEELASALNFKINYIILEDKGFLLDNGTAGGIFKLLQNGSGDMTVCDMWITRNRAKFFDATTGYIRDDIIFVIPPRSELSAFEKLIYPLDFETWIMLAICIGIGSLVIFIITLQNKSVKTFVFGEYEKYPFFTMFALLVGGAQIRTPSRNFARFILLNFLAFSMIIRTAYEGAMYQFMQSDKKYKEPQTVEELIELDYKFNVLAVSMELFEHYSILQKRLDFFKIKKV